MLFYWAAEGWEHELDGVSVVGMGTVWAQVELGGSGVEEAERSEARRVGRYESELSVKDQSIRCFGPSNRCHSPGSLTSQVTGPEAPLEWRLNGKTGFDLQKENTNCSESSSLTS